MVNLDEARKGAPRWRPSHEFLTSQLKEHRQQALARRYNIDIKPIQTEELPDNKHISPARNVMYVPEADNKVALDLFWLNERLFIFQFTIVETHGLLDFFKEYVVPSPSSWKVYLSLNPSRN